MGAETKRVLQYDKCLIEGPGNHGVLKEDPVAEELLGKARATQKVKQTVRKKRNRGMKCVPVRAG